MWHSEGIKPMGAPGIVGWLSALGKNLLILLGLIVLGAITVGISLSATAAQSLVLGWLGLNIRGSRPRSPWSLRCALADRGLGVVRVPLLDPAHERGPVRDIARGALFGSVGLAVLQYFAGALNGISSVTRRPRSSGRSSS